MLRNLRVSSKLLVLIAAPLLALVTLASLAAYDKVAAARRSTDAERLTQIVIDIMPLVDQIQSERVLSSVVVLTGDAETIQRLQGQRRVTDTVAAQLRDTIAGLDAQAFPPALAESVYGALTQLDALAGRRVAVDEALIAEAPDSSLLAAPRIESVTAGYSAAVAALHDTAGAVANEFLEVNGDIIGDSGELSDVVAAYLALAQAKELASLETSVVYAAALADGFRGDAYNEFVQLATGQDLLLDSFQTRAPAYLAGLYDETVTGVAVTNAQGIRTRAMSHTGAEGLAISPELWLSSMQDKTARLAEVIESVTTLNTQADKLQDEALTTASIYVGGALIIVALAALLATIVARSITRPLQRLTEAADDVRHRLPVFVEELRRPDEQPDVQIEPIIIKSRDEMGQLAEAFNAVNAVTIDVAREQAALRASIREMFVNLARRNQSLLDRQLGFIDSLEAGEQDPDVLEQLFKLDHLATRMRRNAESLLVLAGNEPVRRWSEPLPLTDVVRAAMGEIEGYDRVELALVEHVDVVGNAVSSVAHLLAELLENATTYSPPGTVVRLEAHRTGTAVTVTVTDAGMGMTQQQLEEANAWIAEPPLVDIAVSKRLGFFVVGQLAARFGITVELRPSPTNGVTAIVTLPGSIVRNAEQPARLPAAERAPTGHEAGAPDSPAPIALPANASAVPLPTRATATSDRTDAGLVRRLPTRSPTSVLKGLEMDSLPADDAVPPRDPEQIRSMFSEFQTAMEQGRQEHSGDSARLAQRPALAEPSAGAADSVTSAPSGAPVAAFPRDARAETGRHRLPGRGLFSRRAEPLEWSMPAVISSGGTDDDVAG